MPKKVSADKLRVPLNCLIAPATLQCLVGLAKDQKASQGVIVDRAIALLTYGALAENRMPRGVPMTPLADEMMAQVESYEAGMKMFKRGISERPFKGPILKPSQRKEK